MFLAGALLAGLSATASAGATPTHSPSVAVSNARAVEVLHQAQRARAGKGNRDLTITLSRLAVLLPRLSGSQAEAAEQLLARPTDRRDPQRHAYTVREHRPPLCTPHFCIHWVDSTADAPNPRDANANGIPDYVERVALVSETAYAVENTELGWAPPHPDGRRGGNAKTDVYLAQLGNEGLFGFAAPDPGQNRAGVPARSESAYLVMDQNFSRQEFRAPPNESLSVTIAHEYNHVLQFNYDIYQDGWAKEATATWMEDRVYPNVNDYARYMPAWVRRSMLPLTFFSNAKVYGSAVWNHWLAARYGPKVVLNMWQRARRIRPAGFSADAYSSAIRHAGTSNFQRDFARFATDTAEWRVNGRFPEGRTYPDMKRAGTLVSGQSGLGRVNHTGYQLVNVKARRGSKSVRLGVRVQGRAYAAIALVGRIGNGAGARVVTKQKLLRNGGLGSVSLASPGRFSRITAVLVNSDTSERGFSGVRQDWLFTRDRVPFLVSIR